MVYQEYDIISTNPIAKGTPRYLLPTLPSDYSFLIKDSGAAGDAYAAIIFSAYFYILRGSRLAVLLFVFFVIGVDWHIFILVLFGLSKDYDYFIISFGDALDVTVVILVLIILVLSLIDFGER